MSRSLKVGKKYLEKVKFALLRNSFPSQRALALELGLALSTVSRFCTGKPVDCSTFVDIYHALGLEWKDLADLSQLSKPSAKAKSFQSNATHLKLFKKGERNLTSIDKPKTVSTALTVELELPEGQVPLGSEFYIERPPIESRCYETILRSGSLIRIKAPCQMGKSSLMVRILAHASQQDYRTVTINLQLADSRIFQDLDGFLKWFCVSVSKGLGLSYQVDEYWDDIFGSKMSCKDYFENYLLAQLEQPLVLALEEVDRLFHYEDIADDFLALLRSWHEEAKNNLIWQQLRLILVHSTEVYIPLNINQSPFNVGLPIELPEFNPNQIMDLAQRYRLDWNLEQTERLMNMLGGHPGLVRVALYHLVNSNLSLEQLLPVAATETSPFSNHLRRLAWHLQEQPNLAEAMQTVLEANSPVRLDSVEMFKLHSMGLVHLRGNEVTPRCELYRQYFSDWYAVCAERERQNY